MFRLEWWSEVAMDETRTFALGGAQKRRRATELARLCGRERSGPVVLERDGARVEVPAELVEALGALAAAAASGEVAVSIDGGERLLTSQEAADRLNVSRPFVVKLAKRGELASVKVGAHHRFLASDVAAFAESMRRSRQAALRDLAPVDGYRPEDF